MNAQKKRSAVSAAKKKPLRIVHVGNHTTPCIGGIETVIWEIAREMAEKGNHVEIIAFDRCAREGPALPRKENKEGITIHRLPMRRALGFYLYPDAQELIPLLADADIIHVHGLGGWMDVIALHRTRIRGKIIVNSHGGVFHTKQRGWFKKIYLHAWLGFASTKVDGIIYDSDSDAKQLQPFMRCYWEVIPNGIVLPKAVPESVKSKSKIPHFIFVGRMSRNKQVGALIQTFSYLHEQKIPFHLDIVGEDWEGLRGGLESLRAEKGMQAVVTLHGGVSEKELREAYARAQYFVSASSYEGFGISTIEGMAAGCIPIVNRIPTFQSFVGAENAEETRGLLVDYGSPREAAEQIIAFIGSKPAQLQKIRSAARAFAETFSWGSIAQRQLDFYERAPHSASKGNHL